MSRDLLIIAVALFTWGVGEGMFFNFQPIYLSQLGADPVQVGSILGAAGLAMMLAHIPAGYIADRLGRRPVLRAAWTIGLLAAALMALARSLPLFVGGLLLYNLTAFVTSPLDSYVTAARGNWTVGRALTLITATFNAGFVIGPLLGGWLGGRFGLRVIYWLAAGLFVLSTAIIYLLRDQPRDHHDPDAPPASLWSNARYLVFLVIAFLVTFALYLPQPLTPLFLQQVRGLSLVQIGLLGTLGGLGNVLLSLALGHLDSRRGFLLGQVSVGLFVALIWLAPGMVWFGLGYVLLGGYRATRALTSAQVRPLVHPSQMGLAYGLTYTSAGLALAATPWLAGRLYHLRPDLMYPVALGLLALSLVVSGGFFAVERSGGKDVA